MVKRILSSGCSYVRHSFDEENPTRANQGDSPTRPLTQEHEHVSCIALEKETNFTIEAGEKMKIPTICFGEPGSGNRYAIYKVIDYVEKNLKDIHDLNDTFFIIGVTEFTRFDIVRPTYHLSNWPRLPIEEYAKYYDRKDSEFEIKSLLKLFTLYLNSKNIPHIFINTMNNVVSIKDIVPTFIFPDGSEYWRTYIKSYDSNYRAEHPNIADHKILAKLITNKLEVL